MNLLEKAYDRLRWSFIHETLYLAGLPGSLVGVIMKCITKSSRKLLWKGDTTESFVPSREIRHGDPLSPCIFVLRIGRLAHLVLKAVEKS
jgi:hypothetical protein